MKRLALILMVTLTSLAAHAEGGPKPIFVKAKCDGKLSSTLLSSFKDAISTSQNYHLTPTLDVGWVVGYVQMACTERNGVVVVASVYGLAKCVGSNGCAGSLDGSSLNVLWCDTNDEAECGRQLFKGLAVYLNTAKPILKLD
jgi:hypothetical protein